jgi:hypothetical protein
MPEPDFSAYRQRLLRCGVAPRHVRRSVSELNAHYLDLQTECLAAGHDLVDAQAAACNKLGSLDTIAALVTARPELRHWSYRYPRLGRVVLPIAYTLVLPIAPLMIGAGYAPAIARWSAILSLSAAITAGMFLAIQMSITLG